MAITSLSYNRKKLKYVLTGTFDCNLAFSSHLIHKGTIIQA